MTDGHIIMKILILQAAVAVLVLFVLKKFLERELLTCALEHLVRFSPAGEEVDEVVIVTAQKLSADDEFRLRSILKEKFPRGRIVTGEDCALWGGLVVRAGTHVFDFSLWTRIRQLGKRSDT